MCGQHALDRDLCVDNMNLTLMSVWITRVWLICLENAADSWSTLGVARINKRPAACRLRTEVWPLASPHLLPAAAPAVARAAGGAAATRRGRPPATNRTKSIQLHTSGCCSGWTARCEASSHTCEKCCMAPSPMRRVTAFGQQPAWLFVAPGSWVKPARLFPGLTAGSNLRGCFSACQP
eukprot:73261-Chlamydomonas_euryale.AAC.2